MLSVSGHERSKARLQLLSKQTQGCSRGGQ